MGKNILKINLKVHSCFHNYFNGTEFKLDAVNVRGINEYLRSVHPKFSRYVKQIENGHCDESYSLLDKDFKLIESDMFEIKRFKDNDTVYLVPLISGGGGKRGQMLLLFAVAVVAAPYIAAALSAGATATATATTAAQATATTTATTTFASLGKAFGAMNPILRSIVGNLAMAVVTSLFTKSPKATQQTESSTRQNGMFGSLTNTSTSGTPVPLHYGQVRVAGQFLSGYINSTEHGKNDVIKVGDQF